MLLCKGGVGALHRGWWSDSVKSGLEWCRALLEDTRRYRSAWKRGKERKLKLDSRCCESSFSTLLHPIINLIRNLNPNLRLLLGRQGVACVLQRGEACVF